MINYTDDDLKRATNLVEGLQKGEGNERYFRDFEDGLSIADVQLHAQEFYDDLDLLQAANVDFPAVRLGDKNIIPVALSELIPGTASMIGFPTRVWRDILPISIWRDEIVAEIPRLMRRFGQAATNLPHDDARSAFVSRASEFLAARFAGNRLMAAGGLSGKPPPQLIMQKFVGGPPSSVSGCLFSVHTKSPSLSAYWSGAYFISSNYHGAPTTPVAAVLQAGTYVFGVNGGGYGSVVQWDLSKVCTLPGTPSVFLQF